MGLEALAQRGLRRLAWGVDRHIEDVERRFSRLRSISPIGCQRRLIDCSSRFAWLIPPHPKTPSISPVLAALDDELVMSRFLRDIFTPSEVEAIGERWGIVKLLAAGASQRTVRDALGVSIGTVSRGARQLKYGEDGFAAAFDVLGELGLDDPRDEEAAS